MLGALLLLSVVCTALCFPDGAPIDACVKMRANQPNHGQHRSQPPHTSPYRVTASASTYAPNDLITITIEGSEPFKGFFLQARSAETQEWLGSWEAAPHTTVHPECAAVTHADPRDKARATLLWRAPGGHGRVYFTGTVLKNYGTFWGDLVADSADDPRQLQILG
ncbi:hypothetical protein JYU34_006935 [Plutella xylostella]|uniref:Reelin domain-containing protein n=1 Tax=Plutella xylostella TaxID=51655 RepID=A0ABQ7QTC3_PLUXY|nr:hypothetical protein JYU34_006935 [Plutella xylostella]